MVRMFSILALVGFVVCERVHFNGDKVFRITPKNEKEVTLLRSLKEQSNVDFWTEVSKAGVNTDMHIPRDNVAAIESQLKEFGIKYSVLIEDLEKEVANEEKEVKASAFSSRFNYYTYNRLDAIQGELKKLQSKHSSKVLLFSVGKSYEGRDMLAVKVSTGGKKKAIWVDGCIHAREWISCATVMYFLKQLLEPEPFSSGLVQQALKKYDFYVLPVFNVDGYEYSHTNNRMWRKTRSPGMWCRGADPNRNWDSHWGGAGTSSNECSDVYHGKSAFSEIEVKQVAYKLWCIARRQGLKSYWNVHAYSQLLLYPWSYTRSTTKDEAEISRVARIFANGAEEIYGKPFLPGQPSRILYPVAGGSMDWTYEKLGVIYSYAPELRPGRDHRGNGFVVPSSQIRPSGIEFTNGLLKAVLAMK